MRTPQFSALRERLGEGGALSLGGVSPAGQCFLAALIHWEFPSRPLVVVAPGTKAQESIYQDLVTWLRWEAQTGASAGAPATKEPESDGGSMVSAEKKVEPGRVLFYPAWDVLPHESKLPHADVISERLETLVAFISGDEWERRRSSEGGRPSAEAEEAGVSERGLSGGLAAPVVVTSVVALLQRTFPPDHLKARVRSLRRGDRLDPLDLVEWLEDQGYEPEAQVTQKGELALRGGILDLYPLSNPWPVRLEFFGDELESLRFFDPLSQVSRETIESVTIPPAGELGLLKQWLEAHRGERGADEQTQAEGSTGAGRGRAIGLSTVLGYMPKETLLLFLEAEELEGHIESYAGQVSGSDPFHVSWEGFCVEMGVRGLTQLWVEEADVPATMCGVALAQGAPEGEPASWHLGWESLDAYRPLGERPPEPLVAEAQRREFFVQIHRWLRQGYRVHVFCNNDGERQRFSEIWNEYGLAAGGSGGADAMDEGWGGPAGGQLLTHLGALSRGFLNHQAKVVVVTDAEVFGRYKVQRPRRLKSPHAVAARSILEIDFTDLEEGDYVVHLQHGIGRYLGLQILPVGMGRKPVHHAPAAADSAQECLVLEYAPSEPGQPPAKLYVPVTESHLVSKYVGAGKARPPLNTLGGTRWARVKVHAEHAVRDLAAELLAIQAARESQPGFACGPDLPWQREFEAAFLYEETPDQMRSIIETKRDMESAKPMDRLICGDVGYGKTEVAIRAAFKAVLSGKQVAILVPTTILAEQHFRLFRERMADYPVRVEQLSRFLSKRDQQRVIEQVAAGAVDIVIGTHRLLQADIGFKDLGLVVIDEEQRFGVLHKEKFKMLRKLVDVLTLSATPIPRTLYLALTGARDMSTIDTPPQDRLPVQTIVCQYDERVIRDAIQRELNREGQVFFLHNRVLDIEAIGLRIQALAPSARIVIGHGQMDSDDLEEVMTRFIRGDADVLVSTTIIESGIDIPNANTIIINRADRFGLSDLYQLRGRVGRYKHQAYAYLLLPRHATLLSEVRKRISAIKQYSSLGSGFKIAMRDLEIRGAGNLLGPQQSGHITAVGFDLYCQLLKQSISSLKGEKVKPRIDVQVRLDFLALNPGEDGAVPGGAGNFGGGLPALGGGARPKHGLEISVPREVPATVESEFRENLAPVKPPARPKAPAFFPLSYIPESQHRIEMYRKLAQAADKGALERLKSELRDRFGPIPRAVELLFEVAELKMVAADRGISAMETRQDKLMLTRNSDFVMVGDKFPRLSKKEPKARLNEIKRLLLAL